MVVLPTWSFLSTPFVLFHVSCDSFTLLLHLKQEKSLLRTDWFFSMALKNGDRGSLAVVFDLLLTYYFVFPVIVLPASAPRVIMSPVETQLICPVDFEKCCNASLLCLIYFFPLIILRYFVTWMVVLSPMETWLPFSAGFNNSCNGGSMRFNHILHSLFSPLMENGDVKLKDEEISYVSVFFAREQLVWIC